MRVLAYSCLAALLVAQPSTEAAKANGKRVLTASGHPELLLLNRAPGDAYVQLAYVCEKLGWSPKRSARKGVLTCDVPARGWRSVLTVPTGRPGEGMPLDLNSYTQVPVRRSVHFRLSRSGDHVLVRADAQRHIPSPASMAQYSSEAISDVDTFHGLLNVMALVGNVTFAPGTTFTKVGYLGFRSDRFADVELEGRKRVAVQVGLVEAGSPAETAGLKDGDFILRMNGQSFGDYAEVVKCLSALRPGSQVQMLVERGKERLTLAATATAPPDFAAMH